MTQAARIQPLSAVILCISSCFCPLGVYRVFILHSFHSSACFNKWHSILLLASRASVVRGRQDEEWRQLERVYRERVALKDNFGSHETHLSPMVVDFNCFLFTHATQIHFYYASSKVPDAWELFRSRSGNPAEIQWSWFKYTENELNKGTIIKGSRDTPRHSDETESLLVWRRPGFARLSMLVIDIISLYSKFINLDPNSYQNPSHTLSSFFIQ